MSLLDLPAIYVVDKSKLPDEYTEDNFAARPDLQASLQYLDNVPYLEDYVWDLREYPRRLKKLFVQGNSTRVVPRQVLDTYLKTFDVNRKIFFKRYSLDFVEL